MTNPAKPQPPAVRPLAGLTAVERQESYLALGFGPDHPAPPYQPPVPRRWLDNIWWHPGAWLIAVIRPTAALDHWTEICSKGIWSLACRHSAEGLTLGLHLQRANPGSASYEWHVAPPLAPVIVVDIDWRSGRSAAPVARLGGRALAASSTPKMPVRLSDDGTEDFAIGDGAAPGLISALAIWPRGHLPRAAREGLRRHLLQQAGVGPAAVMAANMAAADTAFFMLDAEHGLEIVRGDRLIAWRNQVAPQPQFQGTSKANGPRLVKPNSSAPTAAIAFADGTSALRHSVLSDRQLDNVWHGDGAVLMAALAIQRRGAGARGQTAVLVDKGSWRLQIDRSSTQACLVLDKPGPAGQFRHSWPMPIDGRWHVLSVLWRADANAAPVVRVDGQPIPTTGEGTPGPLAYDCDDDFLIGNRAAGDRGLGGRLAMLGCWPLEAVSDTDLADFEGRFQSLIGRG